MHRTEPRLSYQSDNGNRFGGFPSLHPLARPKETIDPKTKHTSHFIIKGISKANNERRLYGFDKRLIDDRVLCVVIVV